MATTPRLLFAGAAYHITVRAVDGRTLFPDDRFRLGFLARVGHVVERHEWVCDAYCLMTNHFHLLVRTPKKGLPEGMLSLNTWLAVNYNRLLARRGRVLQAPYAAKPILRDAHLLGVARYVPLNPVRAGMVDDPADFEWSSYRPTAGLDRPPRFLTTERLLAQLGGPERYRSFVAAGRGVRSVDEILLR